MLSPPPPPQWTALTWWWPTCAGPAVLDSGKLLEALRGPSWERLSSIVVPLGARCSRSLCAACRACVVCVLSDEFRDLSVLQACLLFELLPLCVCVWTCLSSWIGYLSLEGFWGESTAGKCSWYDGAWYDLGIRLSLPSRVCIWRALKRRRGVAQDGCAWNSLLWRSTRDCLHAVSVSTHSRRDAYALQQEGFDKAAPRPTVYIVIVF